MEIYQGSSGSSALAPTLLPSFALPEVLKKASLLLPFEMFVCCVCELSQAVKKFRGTNLRCSSELRRSRCVLLSSLLMIDHDQVSAPCVDVLQDLFSLIFHPVARTRRSRHNSEFLLWCIVVAEFCFNFLLNRDLLDDSLGDTEPNWGSAVNYLNGFAHFLSCFLLNWSLQEWRSNCRRKLW